MLIKPNQIGTLTETKAALDAAHAAGWRTIVSARSGETEDVTIVHLAVGWRRAASSRSVRFARSERMAKWNEAIRVEEALGADACSPGATPSRPRWRRRIDMKLLLCTTAPAPNLRALVDETLQPADPIALVDEDR